VSSLPKQLSHFQQSIKTRFDDSKRVLSFSEYFAFCEENPYPFLRNAPCFMLDAINHFGTEQQQVRGRSKTRYKIFNNEFSPIPSPVIGHEEVQERIYKILTGFARSGRANKVILMYGPNGSAKSSMARTLFEGLETYSATEEGMLYCFSWVFPHESFDRRSLAIGARNDDESLESFARLGADKIGAIVHSELHENPLLLIPKDERKKLYESWIDRVQDPEKKRRLESSKDSFLRSELSHKNSMIFDALLSNYAGDFSKVLKHVRVERYYLSTKFRKGLVTIEPQLAIDAAMRQISLDRSLSNLPPALQSLNLFQLEGHLIDGNRGAIEFNDLLKRPLEHYKYLLSTSETGSVSLGGILVFIDTVFVGSTNDRQLEAFREHPDYNSFKARIDLVKVPYLLRYSDEEKVYERILEMSASDKEVLPHTLKALALWATCSRLKRPSLKNKNSILTKVLEKLTPLEKAKLYDSGTLPDYLDDEQRRELKGHIEELVSEHQNVPYYEGLLGPSARELKTLIQLAAQNQSYPTVGPNAIFDELRQLVRRQQDFEYLRQEAVAGYHDYESLIEVVRQEWLDWVEEEMRTVLEFEDLVQIRDFVGRYVFQVTRLVRGEKIKNRITGQNEEPDQTLMKEFEGLAGISADIENFRKNIISRLGAWSIENLKESAHPKELPFDKIFPDLMEKIQSHHREQTNAKIKAMGKVILDANGFDGALDSGRTEKLSETIQWAVKAHRGLRERYGYGPKGATEALVALIKARFV
jgi:serine protein kinase